MTKQTEAQRLADLISSYRSPHCGEAAAELRRLHTENAILKSELELARIGQFVFKNAYQVEKGFSEQQTESDAALLRRQNELLKQALEALDGMLQIYGVTELTWIDGICSGADSTEVECCNQARDTRTAIRNHLEGK